MKKTLFLLLFFSLGSSRLSLALELDSLGSSHVEASLSTAALPSVETIVWDSEAIYNKPYTVTDQNSYEFIFEGGAENVFLFEGNTAGIFYVKPNGSASISMVGGEMRPDLTFKGNEVKGTDTNPINGSILNNYKGDISISNFGKLTLSSNTAHGSGGGIYFYSGSLKFSQIDSMEFSGNTARGAGGAIHSVSGNVSFSEIKGNITFSENTVHNKVVGGTQPGGSVIGSSGGAILFEDVGGRILVSQNTDDSKIAAIQGISVKFSNVRGGLEFRDNGSRAIYSAVAIVFDNIQNGVIFDGHDSGTGQGGAISSAGNEGTVAISFSEISGGISFKNNKGATGGAVSAVNSGKVSFDKVSGGIIFENNVVVSGPAGALRSGVLDITNVTGDVVFRDNRTAQDSTSANYGGAIHIPSGAARFDGIQGNVVITGNQAMSTAATRGGAMWAAEDISMSNVSGDILVTNNSSMGSVGDGGAFYSRNAGVSLSANGNIVFQGNTAKSGSGAIYASKGVSLTSTQGDILISNNTAGSYAGAINASGGINLTSEKGNINVSNNSAGSSYGGALYSSSGVVNIQAAEGKTSFVGNTAKGDGGAIYAGTVNITAGKNGVEFLNNTSSTGQGGAISVSKGLNLNAQDGDIIFSGNKAGTNGQQVAIFTRVNYSSSSVPVINLDASAGRSIIMEDAIKAGKDVTININKGTNGIASEGLVHFKSESGSILGSSTTGAILTLNIEAGATIIEGHVEGAGSVNVGSKATLMSGYTSVVKAEDGTLSLSSTTGFESFTGDFVFQEGSRLGTNIRNDSTETWTINMDDLSQAIATAWGDKAASAKSSNSANVIGNVILGNARVQANDILHVGEGAFAEIVEMGEGASVSNSGGSVDVTKLGVSDAIFGSYDATSSKTSSAQIRIDSTKESIVTANSLLAEEDTTTTIGQGSAIIADKIAVTNATLENNGNLAAVGQLTVTSGTLKGSGTFGNVDVQKGQVIVGNSPGVQVYENLSLSSEATVVFSIGGMTANDGVNTGWDTGTYSNISVNQQLSLESGTTFTLELGSEFLASLITGKEYTFDLVFFETLSGNVDDISIVYTVYNQDTQTSSSITNPFENAQLLVSGNTIQFSGVASVPEPSTATMSLLALAMLTMSRRRNRR